MRALPMTIVAFAVVAPWIVGQFYWQDLKVPPISGCGWVWSRISKVVDKLIVVTRTKVVLLPEVGLARRLIIFEFRGWWMYRTVRRLVKIARRRLASWWLWANFKIMAGYTIVRVASFQISEIR